MSGNGTEDPDSAGQSPGGMDALYDQVRTVLGVDATAPGPGVVEALGVAPGVRAIALRTPTLPPATHTVCYVVGPSDGPGALYLVDPASPYPDQQAALDRVLDAEAAAGREVAAVLLTHHHGDHVGAAAHVRARWGARVWAHAETAARLAGRVAIDRALDDGDRAGPLVCVWTPGHAPGHLCFHDPAAGWLIAGDMVAGLGTILIDPDEGDMSAYLASLERMRALAPTALLPAHGPVIADAGGKLAEYVAHRLMREGKVADALAAAPGARPADLVPRAYADTPRALWGLAERSLVAHLIKLEADGRARRDGDRWSPA